MQNAQKKIPGEGRNFLRRENFDSSSISNCYWRRHTIGSIDSSPNSILLGFTHTRLGKHMDSAPQRHSGENGREGATPETFLWLRQCTLTMSKSNQCIRWLPPDATCWKWRQFHLFSNALNFASANKTQDHKCWATDSCRRVWVSRKFGYPTYILSG